MVGDYLSTLRRPAGVSGRDFVGFKREAMRLLLRDGILYRREKAVVPPQQAIGIEQERASILHELHDESRQRGRDATYEIGHVRFF